MDNSTKPIDGYIIFDIAKDELRQSINDEMTKFHITPPYMLFILDTLRGELSDLKLMSLRDVYIKEVNKSKEEQNKVSKEVTNSSEVKEFGNDTQS